MSYNCQHHLLAQILSAFHLSELCTVTQAGVEGRKNTMSKALFLEYKLWDCLKYLTAFYCVCYIPLERAEEKIALYGILLKKIVLMV